VRAPSSASSSCATWPSRRVLADRASLTCWRASAAAPASSSALARELFNSASILPENSENYGYVRDPRVDSTEAKLSQIPASSLSSVAGQWAGLDAYMIRQGYYAAFGHEAFPKFYSTRLRFRAGILSVEYQTDLTSLRLK